MIWDNLKFPILTITLVNWKPVCNVQYTSNQYDTKSSKNLPHHTIVGLIILSICLPNQMSLKHSQYFDTKEKEDGAGNIHTVHTSHFTVHTSQYSFCLQ